jgi:hypothetical protein
VNFAEMIVEYLKTEKNEKKQASYIAIISNLFSTFDLLLVPTVI